MEAADEPRYLLPIFWRHPPTHHLFGLREALNILVHEEGIEQAWHRQESFAKVIWATVDAWGANGGDLTLNVRGPASRSRAVTCIRTSNRNGIKIREWCENTAGLTLGIGLVAAKQNSDEWHNMFRIGHMGHLNLPMVMGTLGSIDSALKELDIPHGINALSAASQMVAKG